MVSYGVTLLSGGLDSTTVACLAKAETDHLTALTFHYGQAHSKEVDCAREIAGILSIPIELMDISFFGRVAWYSALTNPERFPIPGDRTDRGTDPKPGAGPERPQRVRISDEQMGASIPITYVPLRNTFFLTLAAAFLESQVLYAIEHEGLDPAALTARLYMAPNAIDYSGYPDCRPEYFEKIGEGLAYGSKLWAEYRVHFSVETPIISMSKREIVKLGIELGAPLEYTWSCYEGGERPCGSCDSCLLRAKGFQEAGIPDPALTRL